jgi:Na+/melibiose symporter-like transporter
LLRPSPILKGQRFDPLGAALFLFATVALLLGLNQGETWGWTSPAIVGLLLLAVFGAGAFIYVERRVAQPTVDLTLFRNRGFSAAAASAFLSFLALSPVTLLMPFYYQLVLGLQPDETGLLLIAIPATVAILAPLSGTLSDKFGSRLIASAGMAVETLGLASLVFMPASGSPLPAAARLAIVGVGLAFFQSPNSSALFGSVPRSRLGTVGGFQALTRNLGQSVGQVIAAAAWTIVVLSAANGAAPTAVEAPPDAMMAGFRAVFTWSAVLGTVAIFTSLLGRPREARNQTVPGAVPGAPAAAGVPATQTAELSPVQVIEGE